MAANSYYALATAESDVDLVDMLSANNLHPKTSNYANASPYSAEYARKLSGSVRGFIEPAQFSTDLVGSASITICCWFYADALSGTQHISRMDHSTSVSAWRIVLNGSNVNVSTRSQAADTDQAATAFSAGAAATWHFLACIFNYGAGTILTKLDSGSLATTSSLTFGSGTLASGVLPIFIGRRTADNSETLAGAIYGFCVFRGAKTNTFLESLRTATSGLPQNFTSSNTATITVPLVNAAGADQASISGIGWAVLDQSTPGASGYVVAAGTGETTDGAGSLVISIPNTTLTNGQVVTVILSNSNGTPGSSYQKWIGPVAVTV